MLTLIIDLFHSYPDEIGQENAKHDVLATSEAGIKLCSYYNCSYRFYICEDVDQEQKIIELHSKDKLATQNKLALLSQTDFVPQDILKFRGEIRLIINGQGYINDSNDELKNDAIAGFEVEDFIETVKGVIERFHINTDNRPLKELLIYSCYMARSTSFRNALALQFSNPLQDLKLTLFKEMIAFEKGEIISFLETGEFLSSSIENLDLSVVTIINLEKNTPGNHFNSLEEKVKENAESNNTNNNNIPTILNNLPEAITSYKLEPEAHNVEYNILGNHDKKLDKKNKKRKNFN